MKIKFTSELAHAIVFTYILLYVIVSVIGLFLGTEIPVIVGGIPIMVVGGTMILGLVLWSLTSGLYMFWRSAIDSMRENDNKEI